VPKFPPEFI
jgi:hypothetical protein